MCVATKIRASPTRPARYPPPFALGGLSRDKKCVNKYRKCLNTFGNTLQKSIDAVGAGGDGSCGESRVCVVAEMEHSSG
jgi:hypothetical protein